MRGRDGHRGGASARPSRLGKVHPSVVVVSFVALLVSCLVLDPLSLAPALVISLALGMWLVFTGLPIRRLGRLVLFGASLFLPIFLFAPWIEGGDVVVDLWGVATVTTRGLEVPGRIAIRAMVCLLAGAGLAWSADVTRLAVGLSRIPLIPKLLVVMTVQTLRWSAVLIEESRGIARAIALRGGRGSVELVRSLPLVWLPRVIARAERVTAAMEVRGYGGEIPEQERQELRVDDLILLCCVALLCGVSVTLWWTR